MNCNRGHVTKAKSNQEIKSVSIYKTLYFDYENSETEDTSRKSESEISADRPSFSIQKKR